MQPELTLPWEQHTFDTLNLLLAAHERFPKIVKKAALSNSLGVDSLSDPECFTNLTQFIVVSLAVLLSMTNFFFQLFYFPTFYRGIVRTLNIRFWPRLLQPFKLLTNSTSFGS